MSYSGTSDVINSIGGTKNINVGTAGTCDINTAYIETMITKADVLIDVHTDRIYGTNHFGTNQYGTRGVPSVIKSISEDLAGYYVLDSLSSDVQNKVSTFGSRLKDRAMELLNQIAIGDIILTGYTPETTILPIASDFSFDVFDEIVTLSGTALTNLKWQKIIAYSEKVMGTALDGTLTYTRDIDYKFYYWDDRTSGENYGKIRRLSTGSVVSGQDVKVSYKVYKDNNFGLRDARAWGQADSELGQNIERLP